MSIIYDVSHMLRALTLRYLHIMKGGIQVLSLQYCLFEHCTVCIFYHFILERDRRLIICHKNLWQLWHLYLIWSHVKRGHNYNYGAVSHSLMCFFCVSSLCVCIADSILRVCNYAIRSGRRESITIHKIAGIIAFFASEEKFLCLGGYVRFLVIFGEKVI